MTPEKRAWLIMVLETDHLEPAEFVDRILARLLTQAWDEGFRDRTRMAYGMTDAIRNPYAKYPDERTEQ